MGKEIFFLPRRIFYGLINLCNGMFMDECEAEAESQITVVDAPQCVISLTHLKLWNIQVTAGFSLLLLSLLFPSQLQTIYNLEMLLAG